ncbi:MAG: pyridoxal-phosphate dependent enzyme, partial [Aggregatilineales bacterium]
MITLTDIEAAAKTLNGLIVRTPIVKSPVLSERLGTNIYLKLELLQRTGSFKPRGALIQILAREAEAREKGIVAVSGGNFAIAVAFAAHQLGLAATICMPAHTPQNYIDATKVYGATVLLLPEIAEAFAHAEKLA